MDRPIARLAEALSPLNVTYWLAGTLVGRFEPAVPHELARPDHGVEHNVVLSDEVVALGVRVLPPVLPSIWRALELCPLLGG